MHARVWNLGRGTRIGWVLPLLVSVLLLAYALSASSPAHAASATGTRACGRFNVEGYPVSKVRVTNLTCAQAKRLIVHYHNTDRGLSCFTRGDHTAPRIRCKARVAITPAGPSGPRRHFVQAEIDFSLPDCAAAGDCGI